MALELISAQPTLQDEARRSRGVSEPSLAEKGPKIDTSGISRTPDTTLKYPSYLDRFAKGTSGRNREGGCKIWWSLLG